MKKKFENIKGMLKQEEMKMVIGGNAYMSAVQRTAPSFGAGSTLSGSQNANLGMTINYGNNGGNYSTSYNYGAGMTGATGIGTNTSGMTTFNNVGNTGSSGSGYAKP